ncbi:hypothetical protein GGF50DRAFT_58831, partial [Schizophyllum commune]
ALDFDLPAELGDWHVYLSSHAYRDIRKTHREDKSRYKIIVAKIQQLSNGHFSNDNQKRLTQTGARVPIYEAKLTRDSRLVYQVDCVADAKVTDFMIRLYGVYTHAQMDDRLRSIFDAIGVEVGRRGKEYQRRCVFRLPPVNAGDNVFSPATFPLGEDVLQKEYEDVHELIKLEKYFLFSQVRIVADIDAAHVFHLTDKEREIVGHAGSCYVLGRSGTGKTTTMLYKMLGIERAQRLNGEGTSRTVRQLFVTQSHVLVEKVQEAYDKLAKSLHVEGSSKKDLMSLKEERPGTRRDYLIKNDTKTVQKEMSVQRFSELTDQHFPLFLTYDKLCTLLEGDVLPSEERLIGEDFSDLTPRIMQRTGQLVTYRLFFTEYWPHFSQTLTKGLDPALVFSEIMGVIKGSEEASALPSHYLSREGYENLSRRRQSTFASCRNIVYDIFVQYEKEKARRGDYDAADRYVDEVQDNLLIDARGATYLQSIGGLTDVMLRHITRFANGLFWAGDTAQTISVGSAFRFKDLKAYLHRLEEEHNFAINRRPPRSFQLTTNYRSHAGIVDCAQTVIDLITTNWPDSIDQLAREEGEVAGVKPVFLTGWSSDTLCYEQFLFTTSSGNAIEFGAKQCILVRHEEARRRLRSRVILYDFFQDSLVTASQWRMVLNHMSPDYRPRIPAPRFEETLHAGVCSELKFLYVAITRARKNVWIVDTSERAEPMRLLWTSWNRIDNRTPANVPRLAVSSTRKEWEEEGIELFKSEHYDEARFCYERAGMLVEMAIAHAYYLHVCAALKPSDGSRSAIPERRKAFLDAATAFIGCAETAGASGLPERQKAYYRVAANAYLDANDAANAARIFVEAGEFVKGAEIYRGLGNFDETLKIVQAHGSHMDITSKSRLLHVCRLYYFQAKQYRKACASFGSLEEALQFLEETPFNVGKAALLESAGRFREAAELQIVDNPAHAVDLFFVDAADNLAVERGWDCISDGLWTEFAFGANIEAVKGTPLVLSYLRRSEEFFRMFHALVKHDSNELKFLARFFLDTKKAAPAFRCLQGVFQPQFPNIRDMSADALIDTLLLFKHFVRLLHDMAFDFSPCDKASIRRILGLRPLENGRSCFAPSATYVYGQVRMFRPVGTQFTDDGVIVPTPALTRLLSMLLQSRLHASLLDEDFRCRRAVAFRPICWEHMFRGDCLSMMCERVHQEAASLDASWYNQQVRLHLLQISILDFDVKELAYYHALTLRSRFWINKLYNTIFPATSKLGTPISLSKTLIPEAHESFQQVKYWCQDVLKASAGIAMFLQVAHLSYTFDRSDAQRYLYVMPAHERPQASGHFFRDGRYIVAHIHQAIAGHGAHFIMHGVSFLRQVVDKKLEVDINALCDLCEHLTCSFIRERSLRGFHDVTLPKSWIITFVNRFKNARFMPITYAATLFDFIDGLAALLNVLYNGFGSTICIRSYSHGRNWADFSRAYESSTKDQLMDELVTMRPQRSLSRTSALAPRQVFYKADDDIPTLLGYEPFAPSSFRVKARVAIRPPTQTQTRAPSAIQSRSQTTSTGTQLTVTKSKKPATTSTLERSATECSPSRPSAAQKVVAYRLLCMYRRRMRRRSSERARADFFATCKALENEAQIAFPCFRVQVLYRNALPRILTCLDIVVTHLESVKTQIRQEFEVLDHHEKLEAISDKLEGVNAALREAKALASATEPRPETYSAPDCLSRLQEHTRTLVAMTERLPPARRLVIASDLEVVVFSVLTYEDLKREKRVEMHRKKAKPTLNTYDDEYGQFYY